jgi:phenylacetate-CoA ligase
MSGAVAGAGWVRRTFLLSRQGPARDPGSAHARAVRDFYAGNAEQVAARALERLRRMLAHARDTVPLQASRLAQAGVVPERVRGLDDLAGLPVTTRHDVAARASELTSRAVPEAERVVIRTGGTSGEPVPFVQDRDAVAWKDATALVLRERLGWPAGARAAYLWGAAQDLPPGARGWWRRVKEHVRERWILRSLYLPAGDLSDAVLDRHLDRLEAFGPGVLQGYPTATDLLARRAAEQRRRLEIPLVLLTAEPVLPTQRERIAQAFDARVLAFYGARECGWIASECAPYGRAHVNTHGVALETTPDGRLLVTDLVNRAMPMLRYEIGDLGTLDAEPCPCGDPRPVLSRLEGRMLDVFVLPSGRRVPGVVPDVRGVQQDALGITDAQIVQEDLHHLRVRYVAGPNFREAHLAPFKAHLSEVFFGELAIELERVDRILPGPNGKVRHCLSLVKDAPGAPP